MDDLSHRRIESICDGTDSTQHTSHLIISEKGICISTLSLWILLVYTEASLRLKDLKTSHANLSHLFAAHWYVELK